ncbi:MAG: hypothetical protein D6744_10165, partial [Planctomycetota bacterium]
MVALLGREVSDADLRGVEMLHLLGRQAGARLGRDTAHVPIVGDRFDLLGRQVVDLIGVEMAKVIEPQVLNLIGSQVVTLLGREVSDADLRG